MQFMHDYVKTFFFAHLVDSKVVYKNKTNCNCDIKIGDICKKDLKWVLQLLELSDAKLDNFFYLTSWADVYETD